MKPKIDHFTKGFGMSIVREFVKQLSLDRTPKETVNKFLTEYMYGLTELRMMLAELLSRPMLMTPSEAMMLFIGFRQDSKEYDELLLILYLDFARHEHIVPSQVAKLLKEAEKTHPTFYALLREVRERAFNLVH